MDQKEIEFTQNGVDSIVENRSFNRRVCIIPYTDTDAAYKFVVYINQRGCYRAVSDIKKANIAITW